MRKIFKKYKPHYQDTLGLAIPVVISQLGHTVVQAADSIIVGHFAGTVSLAAVALANSLFTIIMVFGIGIAYGLTPLIAQENGGKRYIECGRLLTNSLLINIVVGVLLFIFVYFGMLVAISHFDQLPEVVSLAKPYLLLLGLSIIPMMAFMAFKQFAEGLGFTRQAMMISIWGNVLNILLGIVLVRGMFGIETMGVKGVGVSTLIDRILMALVMGIYVFKSRHFTTYLRHFGLAQVDFSRMKRILKLGAPVALQYTFEVGAFSAAAMLMGVLGVIQQAAHQVAISLASMTYMMSSGVSAAATIKSGTNYGSNSFTALRFSAISSYHIIIAFMCITAALFIAFNGVLPWIYTSDPAVVGMAAQLLLIAGVFQLFDGTQVVGLGILRGMGDVNIPTIITFIAYWVVGIPMAYYLGIVKGFGANAIWYGLTTGLCVSSLLLFLRFQFISKKLT